MQPARKPTGTRLRLDEEDRKVLLEALEALSNAPASKDQPTLMFRVRQLQMRLTEPKRGHLTEPTIERLSEQHYGSPSRVGPAVRVPLPHD